MYSVKEIEQICQNESFQTDYSWVRNALLQQRYHRELPSFNGQVGRLSHFVEAVLASAPDWDGSRQPIQYCRMAGEISELLSIHSKLPRSYRRKMRIRSAFLYELAEMPSISSAVLDLSDLAGLIDDMLFRRSYFRKLGSDVEKLTSEPMDTIDGSQLERAMSDDCLSLARYEQGLSETPTKLISATLAKLATELSLELTATELQAFDSIIKKRIDFATRTNVSDDLFEQLKQIYFPTELWAAQVKAVKNGLMNAETDSWGFAAPTGSGKTFLTKLLILDTLKKNPNGKVLYIVPTKALVHEVWLSLSANLEKLDYKVIKVTPQIVALDGDEESNMNTCSVAVITPEKADLLLRLGSPFAHSTDLIVVDEAHHIESGTRGALLELYLWRIKKLFKKQVRVVFLSAVAPNITDFAQWLGKNSNGVVVDQRATRMRAGVYRIKKPSGYRLEGWIDYADKTSIQIVTQRIESSQRGKLLQLIQAVVNAGPVLVVAKGKGTTQTLAKKFKEYLENLDLLEMLSEEEMKSPEIARLDSRLHREMDKSVVMRSLLKHRIAYHHAGLPPRVRIAVEDAIRAGYIKVVFATTTLAEGVNFPFSTVIVQSLALKGAPEKNQPVRYSPVTPRSFWNIAGRAGRPGHDREGQVILFEPSLGLEKINAVIGDYLDSSLNGVKPVSSALANSLNELSETIEGGNFTIKDVSSVKLPPNIPKQIKGTINLLRVGIVHAKASVNLPNVESILEGTFAEKFIKKESRQLINRILQAQSNTVDEFFQAYDAPSEKMVAELGLSLETLVELRNYIRELEDWKLEGFSKLFYGGSVNLDNVVYVVGPVTKRMAELEGGKLGGFYTSVIVQWLAGLPLTKVKAQANVQNTLEELISVIYSRVQFLLPWGLYAMHELVLEECKRRGLSVYDEEILTLAYLIDAGVPNFDALRLVNLEFERVDATRLSKAYAMMKQRARIDTDIIGWLITQSRSNLYRILRGSDNRPIDHDLPQLLDQIGVNG